MRLSRVFAVEVCAYAVMHNHTHLVLNVDVSEAQTWTCSDIYTRWFGLFRKTSLGTAFMDEATRQGMSTAELSRVTEETEIFRQRLCDISWFMRALNEYVARKANKEDSCTGRFWEGRFKSQALLDEPALMACMAYVDLNPVRAGISKNPERSAFTSIKKRVDSAKRGHQAPNLKPFKQKNRACQRAFRFTLQQYLALLNNAVATKSHSITASKQDKTSKNIQMVFSFLQMRQARFYEVANAFETTFSQAAGKPESMHSYQQKTGIRHIKGIVNANRIFSPLH